MRLTKAEKRELLAEKAKVWSEDEIRPKRNGRKPRRAQRESIRALLVVAGQIGEDICVKHAVYLCPKCFDMRVV